MNVESEFDHLAVAALADPFETLAEARRRCPVAHSSAHGGFWALFAYEDISSAARAPERLSSASGVTIPHHGFPLSLPPIETDPPQHIQFRAPLLQRFSPGTVAHMEPALRAAVTDLIDSFIERGVADLAVDLCARLPGIAVTHLLAIPDGDAEAVKEWTVRLIQDPMDMDAIGDAMEYFAAMYDDRRASPKDDIPTLLLNLMIDERPISEEEYLCTMNTLVMAGLDTTANAAANILEVLDRFPDKRQELREARSRVPAALEELLRYVTPLPSLCRTATQDFEIRGRRIGRGERVQLNWIAANHDPDEFPEPETLDFDRPSNRHLAFGGGPHRCLGAHLARLELRIIVEEVLERLPDYKVDRDGVKRYSGITRGILSLPVVFEPGLKRSSPHPVDGAFT